MSYGPLGTPFFLREFTRDPNKPKRACSAYLFFTTTRRAEIAAEQPELVKNVPEMAKTLRELKRDAPQ